MSSTWPKAAGREEETRRVARILGLVQAITAQPRQWTRKRFAAKYEVGERQIQKDLQIVRHGLCLPLERTHTGYYFESIPKLPSLSYTLPEALSLLLAVHAGRQIAGVNSGELAAAVGRLESVFPEPFAALLRRAATAAPAAPTDPERETVLAIICSAMAQRRALRIVYASASHGGVERERLVEPYQIVPYERSWQMIAYCHLRGEVRFFKVDRIRSVDLTDNPYQANPEFDYRRYMGSAWGIFRSEHAEPDAVVLCFAPAAGRRVREEAWHPSQTFEEQRDGSMIMRLVVPPTPDFVSWIAQFGPDVRVIAPERLREAVLARARTVVDLYTDASSVRKTGDECASTAGEV